MQKKILVVDDEADFREILSDYLTDSGYILLEAEDGVEGLRVLEQERPDLLILDMRMPKMDGMDVLRKMQEKQTAVNTIVLSGLKEENTESEALRLGARQFLTKPIDLEFLTSSCIQPLLQ